jgi:hypothetical protein
LNDRVIARKITLLRLPARQQLAREAIDLGSRDGDGHVFFSTV